MAKFGNRSPNKQPSGIHKDWLAARAADQIKKGQLGEATQPSRRVLQIAEATRSHASVINYV